MFMNMRIKFYSILIPLKGMFIALKSSFLDSGPKIKKKVIRGLRIMVTLYVQSLEKADYYTDLVLSEADKLACEYGQTLIVAEGGSKYIMPLDSVRLQLYFELKPDRLNLKFGRRLSDYCFKTLLVESDVSNLSVGMDSEDCENFN